jgi:NADH-quinone oxidoreductase subunit H
MTNLLLLIFNIISMLFITMLIAILTLIERKILSLVQRRIGPFYIGYKGRLQYLADALKLFVKEIFIPYKLNKFLFIFFPSLIVFFSYIF